MKISKEYFDRRVKCNKIKGIYHAFITWGGYDYTESAISEGNAKWLLYESLR